MAVTRIDIAGKMVGIVDLEEIFGEMRSLGLADDEALKEAIFGKVQAGNYIPAGMVRLYQEALLAEYRVFTGEAQRKAHPSSSPEIRLYGSSCFRCESLDHMIKGILSRAMIRADYQHISDLRELARAGVLTTPAIVVNGRMVLQGQLPPEGELETLLIAALGGEGKP